ncbi:RHS repeat-associated core domain-containing protein [Pseudomonas sp. PCH199]|uniref:RHS repeat-associated core domain-containing protein n=1 Tax=unclassified Pseudomonas TaxID=196821 RepID=UPI000BD0B00A|nr:MULTISPECIES: RHS repeat-associated core domain-containing protein [unclassified Pseudomonas]MCW8274797.1 RHS repeat-associated core domain-containing protein [Pseudomonas sp. PCH199]PAM85460.1 hypothetical protein CES87_03035 [Pseudomonas sp. ERMR1:02]
MPTHSRKTILLATDRQNSVLNAVDAAQNNAIAYTPYGDSPMGDDPRSQLRFNGECQELITGYYPLGNGYRMYSPRLGRFLIPDSLSPFGAGWLNAYAYCECDPINRVDPTGHAWGFLKEIGRGLGLRTSNKAKFANTFNADYGQLSSSRLFANDALKKAAKLGEPRQIDSLIYNKKMNTLQHHRNVKNDKFSFTSITNISSEAKQLSPEILTSITPIENLQRTSRSTYEYVNRIQHQLDLGSPIGMHAINRTSHPTILKNQQKAIRKSEISMAKYRNAEKMPSDPNRFLYRSGGM